ncbi:hypothetical protein BFW38_04865 [Terasakiispira papahanaumokuakeensis]|uniref:Ribonuclease E n=1 Tax=Terasakiispira papahanaumokuakeensis TaxID=197479 RepID=A0A1E2V7J0_9GAMM|nr:ribonuclease E [Terasakiispira papahanaumokuakeensis]ODC02980.1 hypothetical protein BFW38_04865 [Terasakiispira papahanaumokuakeensis]
MKRMLINATQPEERRVALVDGQRLYDLDIESGSRESKKANIYRGKITRIEPSLEAAFVDFGAERHGFLPLKEISREYFYRDGGDGRPNIKDVLREGTEVTIQVDKEERGNKGAALTTFISLAGRYLVLMPNNPRAGGISRRIEGDDRAALREAMNGLQIPNKMGVIVRTAGVGRSTEELQWDLDYLVKIWQAIQQATAENKAPFLVYRESNVIIRAMRDYLRTDIGEVQIDSPEVYAEAQTFIQQVMPAYQNRIKLYQDDVPLFSRFQIESQIETAFERNVKLPSGGSIVIDHTEALVSIDINSARATRGGDIEETALQTNLEAADEIARQLRLRDIGGLIVIDFIDMSPVKNQREVENRMRDALKVDRARVQIGRISRFGLLEMSRQRLRPSLGETSGVVCPRCDGQGTIRDVRSLSLSILRLIEEEAMKERSAQIRSVVPVAVATFLLNEKRAQIADIEQRQDVEVLILPNPNMHTPHYQVDRLRDDHVEEEGDSPQASHEIDTSEYADPEPDLGEQPVRNLTEAAVKSIAPRAPAPEKTANSAPTNSKAPAPSGGLLTRLFKALFGSSDDSSDRQEQRSTQTDSRQRDNNQRDNSQRTERQNSRQRQNDNRRNNSRNKPDYRQKDKDDTEQSKGRDSRSNGQSKDTANKDSGNRDNGRDKKRNRDDNRQDKRKNNPKDNRSNKQNAAEKSNDNQDRDAQAKESASKNNTNKSQRDQSSKSQDQKSSDNRNQDNKPQDNKAQDNNTQNDGKPKRQRNNPRSRRRNEAITGDPLTPPDFSQYPPAEISDDTVAKDKVAKDTTAQATAAEKAATETPVMEQAATEQPAAEKQSVEKQSVEKQAAEKTEAKTQPQHNASNNDANQHNASTADTSQSDSQEGNKANDSTAKGKRNAEQAKSDDKPQERRPRNNRRRRPEGKTSEDKKESSKAPHSDSAQASKQQPEAATANTQPAQQHAETSEAKTAKPETAVTQEATAKPAEAKQPEEKQSQEKQAQEKQLAVKTADTTPSSDQATAETVTDETAASEKTVADKANLEAPKEAKTEAPTPAETTATAPQAQASQTTETPKAETAKASTGNTAAAPRKGRAPNDPREIRRRQREAEAAARQNGDNNGE